MYRRSFLCEEAKIKQRTPLKKELCEISEEAIWESRFTSFFISLTAKRPSDDQSKRYLQFCRQLVEKTINLKLKKEVILTITV